MPELPEVETVCRGLAPVFEGEIIKRVTVRQAALRIPVPADFAARVQGRRVTSLARRAKYILIALDDGATVIAHLGMSGRMIIFDGPPPPPGRHDHLDFETAAGKWVRFCDPRRFGLVTLAGPGGLDAHPLLRHLGPDPLGNAFNGPALASALKGRKTPIKAALLDQKVIAGIGNIYASESLFRAGLSPRRKAATVQGGRAEKLARAIRAVLTEAIAAGGSSLRDHVRPDGELGYFQHSFGVYGRQGAACPGCDCDLEATGGIARLVQSGRSTFYCPRRQR